MMHIYNGLNTLLTNIQEMTSLRHGCTHIAEYLEPTTNELTCVTLKNIVGEGDGQLLDFYQVNYFTCKMQIVLLTCLKTDHCCNDCICLLK